MGEVSALKEAEIEILEEETVSKIQQDMQLPVNYMAVGSPENEDVQVYMHQTVYKEIEKHATENMSKEVGSILLGRYMEEGERRYVVISGRIEARYTDATASTLTFTHETWDYVNRMHEKKYPDAVIVGWQHTHPGYGIFLSNYDKFIQENFFNLPWQVAYVVDPIASERGNFTWKENKAVKQNGFYIYDAPGKKLAVEEKTVQKKRNYISVLLSVLLLISILVTVAFGVERNRLSQALSAQISREQTPKQTEAATAESEKPQESFYVHVVQPGDTLEAICESYGLEYTAVLGKVLRINSMQNPDKIYHGQTLYLPMQ